MDLSYCLYELLVYCGLSYRVDIFFRDTAAMNPSVNSGVNVGLDGQLNAQFMLRLEEEVDRQISEMGVREMLEVMTDEMVDGMVRKVEAQHAGIQEMVKALERRVENLSEGKASAIIPVDDEPTKE